MPKEKSNEELAGEAITNEEILALGVGNLSIFPFRYCDFYSVWLMRLKTKTKTICLLITSFLLQMIQKDDIITTENILEFHMGPEETKMVKCSHGSVVSKFGVLTSGLLIVCILWSTAETVMQIFDRLKPVDQQTGFS